jgi:hypothetical protein
MSEPDFVSQRDLRLNKRNRERLAILERRHDHLADRVEDDSSLTYDAAECAALHWAVRVLRTVLVEVESSEVNNG